MAQKTKWLLLICIACCLAIWQIFTVWFGKKTTINPPILIQQNLKQTTINAQDYQQFWLWTAPKHPETIRQAKVLYILQGEIRSANQHTTHNTLTLTHLTPQGLGVRPLPNKQLWLVYRATSQTWSPEVMPAIIAKLQAWQQQGNQVVGMQIDFDAPTFQLDDYAKLLTTVRKALPSNYKLSVTGLLDWANQANNPSFIDLGNSIDELVMQTYQGTTTLPNYTQYLNKLDKVPFDFKIGVVEGGQWQGADFLQKNPRFKGYVVFLR